MQSESKTGVCQGSKENQLCAHLEKESIITLRNNEQIFKI